MLRSIRTVLGYTIQALDGYIGLSKDFLFDDRQWVVRYLIVKTEKWLPGRKVLVSPRFINDLNWAARIIKINCSRVSIESSPRLDMHAPVSHEFETAFYDHYTVANHWPVTEPRDNPTNGYAHVTKNSNHFNNTANHNPPISKTYGLQLVSEVTGYNIEARDKLTGHVEDFIVDEHSWQIRYLVIDTRNWLPAPKVIVNPQWFKTVDWNHKKISTRLTARQIKDSPRYHPWDPVNIKSATCLYDYRGRPVK